LPEPKGNVQTEAEAGLKAKKLLCNFRVLRNAIISDTQEDRDNA